MDLSLISTQGYTFLFQYVYPRFLLGIIISPGFNLTLRNILTPGYVYTPGIVLT